LEISPLPEHAPMFIRPYISRLGNGKLGHLSWLPMPLRTHLEEQHALALDTVGHVDLITDRKGRASSHQIRLEGARNVLNLGVAQLHGAPYYFDSLVGNSSYEAMTRQGRCEFVSD